MLFTMGFKFGTNSWNKRVIEWDVISYYSYLPATFIHNDISLSFIENGEEDYSKKFWPRQLENGNYIIKTSMGMSIMYAPFFFIAHAYENLTGNVADGYSAAYKTAISFGTLFYLLLGLLLTKKLLQKFFPPIVTAITILLIYFATNLFYYATIEPGMSHAYSFALIAAFIFFCDKWLTAQKMKHAIFLGLLTGIITLIRPSNVLIVLLIPLWGIASISDFKKRMQLLLKQWPAIGLMIIMTLLVWLPQMLYWKSQTGHFLFNSYDEQFFFGNFNIHKALFGFRKGWLIYTPIMILAILGIFISKKQFKNYRLSYIVFLPIFIYVTYSWWCWWYGGSYSSRPMVDIYALMAIPLAGFLDILYQKRKYFRIAFFTIFIVFTAHGYFQTIQFIRGAIHWDSMTREAYFESFLRIYPTQNYYFLLQPPDYENAILGNEEDFSTPETSTSFSDNDYYFMKENLVSDQLVYYNLVNIIMPDTVFNPLVKVNIVPDSENKFKDETFLIIAIYKDNEFMWANSLPLKAASKNSSANIYDETEIPLSNFGDKNLNIKVFLNSPNKDNIHCKKIEVIIEGVANYIKEN